MPVQAVVIGIDKYKGLAPLNGPCRDAQRFKEWLEGNIPQAELQLQYQITSIKDGQPVRPRKLHIDELFQPFVEKFAKGERYGGTLMIYAAGHGMGSDITSKEVGLFTTEATALMPYHVVLTMYADWFKKAYLFDEIILIMDCCRNVDSTLQLGRPDLLRIDTHPKSHEVKTFIAFATGDGQSAREGAVRDGETVGFFSEALMQALTHASLDANGQLTGTRIRDYVHTVFPEITAGRIIPPPDIDARPNLDVVFPKRVAQFITTTFTVPESVVGNRLVITSGFGALARTVHEVLIEATTLQVPMQMGVYKATIGGNGNGQLFQVPTQSEIHVN